MDRWHVVHTQTRGEDRALWHLESQGFRCFLPRCRKSRRHGRKVDVVLEPLFPRYLFAQFDAATCYWRTINGTRGVINLLTDGAAPLAVPIGAVEKLLKQADEEGITPLSSLGVFAEGMTVRVSAGPFAGQIGEVTEIFARGSDRIRILLAMLGTKTSLNLPSYVLEVA